LRFGLLQAGKMGIDVISERKKVAEKLVEQEAFLLEGTRIIVNGDTWSSLYDVCARKCSCVAYSQGIKCVCSYMAENIHVPINSQEDDGDQSNKSNGNSDNLSVQQMLSELSSWANSDSYSPDAGTESLIARAHSKVFRSFSKRTNVRKIKVLHPHRRNITQSRRVSAQHQEHTYHEQVKTRRGVKRKTPSDFKVKTYSSSVKKIRRVKGIAELYKS